ncbi:Calcium-transporting ATPase 1 [bacterium HR27]|nr:Calcium-transporting ATPase 1 [bacterium HR27]
MTADAPQVRVVHRLPGRVRFRIDATERLPAEQITRALRLPGIVSVRTNSDTGSVLVTFVPDRIDEQELLATLTRELSGDPSAPSRAHHHPPVHIEHRTQRRTAEGRERLRVRLAVRGLEGNQHLAQVIERELARFATVTVRASAITGRVLVEHDPETTPLDQLLETITGIDLPELVLPSQRTVTPTDRAPLYYAAWRATASATALGLLAVRQLLGGTGHLTSNPLPVYIADAVTVLRGFPQLREGLRRLLGPFAADILTSSASIASQVASNQQLGLLVSLSESLRLLSALLPWRRAWERYEAMALRNSPARPGEQRTLRRGERAPFALRVSHGSVTILAPDCSIRTVEPEQTVPSGALLLDGEVSGSVELPDRSPAFAAGAPKPVLLERYLRLITPLAFAYAGLVGLFTRSLGAAARALVLVNARSALIGAEAADLGAIARSIRNGALSTVLRSNRRITSPTVVVLDHPALLTHGFELDRCLPLDEQLTVADALIAAATLAQRTPWRSAFPQPTQDPQINGLDRSSLRLEPRPLAPVPGVPETSLLDAPVILTLESAQEGRPLALYTLRPSVSEQARILSRACRAARIRLIVRLDERRRLPWLQLPGLEYEPAADAAQLVQRLRERGEVVLFVTDGVSGSSGLTSSHLGVLIASSRHPLDIPADLIVPDLGTVAALLETAQRRDQAVRDSVVLSLAANVVSLGIGFGLAPPPVLVSLLVSGSAFLALVAGWVRLWGGTCRTTLPFVEPEPERWAALPPEAVLQKLRSRPEGLSDAEARQRRTAIPVETGENPWLRALISQASSPLLAIMAAGAGLSLAVGASLDVAIILATLLFNVAIGVWQEERVSRATAQLAELSTPPARILRNGEERLVPASEVVPGDIILLNYGDRVPADAQLLEADNLLVDESALTGESSPVVKDAAAADERAIVLAGSDVISGTGRAVVVAVAEETRLGATKQALQFIQEDSEVLAARLAQFTRLSLPVSVGAAALVTAVGILRGAPPGPQLALGASLAIAAVPEGLPLLSRFSEAATARRLARRGILVRRISAVEALGRVNVVCVDKTGTLTYGKLRVQKIAAPNRIESLSRNCSDAARAVLLSAVLASPRAESVQTLVHSTDAAIFEAAQELGLAVNNGQNRYDELPFDSLRPYHAVRYIDRTVIKGSPEFLLPRVSRVRFSDGTTVANDTQQSVALHETALALAREGLRVLLVTEGSPETALEDPRDLVALGFVGIADSLRPAVAEAVRRCQEAGVRIIMITGDHPLTAEVIARRAGLPVHPDQVLTATDLRELDDRTLSEKLATTTVVARATPLDKLRIVQLLRARGQVVAMTGDGVNDAPALRLADVGIAMGWGTAVAREAADLVLVDDDFAAVVDALIEGRRFWRNMRRAVALLLGGNLGELGMIAIPALVNAFPPLNTRQVLMVNLITDVPPALAIAFQEPRHRRLVDLAREGEVALDRSLRIDVFRRAAATALPAAVAALWASRAVPAEASTIGFASLVLGQLAQAIELSATGSGLTPSLLSSIAASTAVLAATLAVPPLRTVLGLSPLSPTGLFAVGSATAATILVSRLTTLIVRELPAPAPAFAAPVTA